MDCLHVDKTSDCWTLTLNRADKRNALNAELVEALIVAIEQAHDAQVDCLVLRGQGKSFCAGFDFTGFDDLSEGELLWRFVRIEQLLQLLHASPALTVALVQGKNLGAGVDLMAACKHRVAASDAAFRMPGLKFGLVLGTRRLASLIGVARAREIQQVARMLDATEALETGLISGLAPESDWENVVRKQREAARALSPEARQSLYRVLRSDTDDADLADLVRSVMAPGIKQRIAKYRAGE